MWRAAFRFKFMNNSYPAARTRRSEDRRAFSVVVSRIFPWPAIPGPRRRESDVTAGKFRREFRFTTDQPGLGVILERIAPGSPFPFE